MNKERIIKKRQQVSRRIAHLDYLADVEMITLSKFTKSRQKLIAELHTLDFILGKTDMLDSDEWFKKLEGSNENNN